jgi:hypothetical protein
MAAEVLDPWETPHGCGAPGCRPLEHCFSHSVDEPVAGDDWHCICFECGHLYQTEDELVEAYNRGGKLIEAEVDNADEIYFCPYCLHNF